MFVSYEPELCFDVYRNSDRCVCGRSALITSHDGQNSGYCKECSAKRDEFVLSVIGSINIERKRNILDKIENLRKSILKERIYYMIDKFFAEHQNDEEFSEPYNNKFFLSLVYREKHFVMEMIINSIKNNDKKNSKSRIYDNYVAKLIEMNNQNLETLRKITEDNEDYTFKRKIVNN